MTAPVQPSHLDIQELLGAYALDAVDADEARIVEAHLDSCPRCRDEERAHREVASLLSWSGEEAPVHVWDRLAGDLESHLGEGDDLAPLLPFVRPPVLPAAATVTRRGRVGRIVASVAAVVVLGVGTAAVANVVQDQSHLSAAQQQLSSQYLGLARSQGDRNLLNEVVQVSGSPGVRTVHLEDKPGGTRMAEAYLTTEGQIYVVALPALQAQPLTATYQLWAVKDGQRTSLGLLGPTPTVLKTNYGPSDIALLAITAEDKPQGSVISLKDPVATGFVASLGADDDTTVETTTTEAPAPPPTTVAATVPTTVKPVKGSRTTPTTKAP